jgi:hypothetical protein
MKRFVVIAVVAGLVLPVVSQAEVLHDTLYMVDDDVWNSTTFHTIGGEWGPNYDRDSHCADDFLVPGALGYELDTVTIDVQAEEARDPYNGILVEVFADLAGFPGEAPVSWYMASPGEVSSSLWDPSYYYGIRYTATIPDGAIVLAPGSYFMSIVGVSTIPQPPPELGNQWYAVRDTRPEAPHFGADTFARNGGQDHMYLPFGGLPGLSSRTDDFKSLSELGEGLGDLSMQITGTEIPEPATLALLGLGILVLRRR